MLRLSDTITRCLGDECDEREDCERYSQRMYRSPQTLVVHTMRRQFQAAWSPCNFRIHSHDYDRE